MNTANTYVRARIDADTKEKATAALSAMGLSVSDAIRLLMIRIADEHRLPFEIQSPKIITQKAIAEAEAGKDKCFDNVEMLIPDSSVGRGSSYALLAALKAHPLPESARLSDADIDAQIQEISDGWE